MTAEIAIINKSAIALAADSAVTIGTEIGPKIYDTVDKLFRLSRHYPIGIMIHGAVSFLGVPWETIVKEYRDYLGKKNFIKLEEFAEDFIKFLVTSQFFSEFEQDRYVELVAFLYSNEIFEEIKKRVGNSLKEGGLSDSQIKKIASGVINEVYSSLTKMDNLDTIPSDHLKKIKNKYQNIILKTINKTVEKTPLFKKDINKLIDIIELWFCKDTFPHTYSGVVIAGFGKTDLFPKLLSFKFETIICEKVKYKKKDEIIIGNEEVAQIIPFAQSDMVYTFMESLDPTLEEVINYHLTNIFNDYPTKIISEINKFNKLSSSELKECEKNLHEMSIKLFESYNKEMRNFRFENYVQPIMKVVSSLPKDELSLMAETLVNLTKFKQKVSIEAETVGGPIDVAVISKGDGFVWIKRKYYFDKDLNPRYTIKYLKED